MLILSGRNGGHRRGTTHELPTGELTKIAVN